MPSLNTCGSVIWGWNTSNVSESFKWWTWWTNGKSLLPLSDNPTIPYNSHHISSDQTSEVPPSPGPAPSSPERPSRGSPSPFQEAESEDTTVLGSGVTDRTNILTSQSFHNVLTGEFYNALGTNVLMLFQRKSVMKMANFSMKLPPTILPIHLLGTTGRWVTGFPSTAKLSLKWPSSSTARHGCQRQTPIFWWRW